MDYAQYPYASKRFVTIGRRGMVCTSQNLAAGAGLEILKKGGNAIDAAVATAAALTVLEPQSNGIGSDCFAILWVDGKMHGLNSSGFAPELANIKELTDKGYTEMPKHGLYPVTVSGTPAGWAALNERFGRLPLSEVLAPAIDYAENGFALTVQMSQSLHRFADMMNAYNDPVFDGWFRTFNPDNIDCKPGDFWRLPDHAETLKKIGETKARWFYEGDFAEKLDAYSRKFGGWIRKEDLAKYQPEWVDPVNVNYRGYDVWELPPNGHGIVALMALNLLKGFELSGTETVESWHKQIECLKLAFMDGKQYITDPKYMKVKVSDLLSDAYADERRKLIGDKALMPTPGQLPSGGTVYLCAADGEGNMISYIQSNYMGFGSGVVIPGTGVALQNRGNSFFLDESHVNHLEPFKRPYHTIIPGFLTKGDKAIGPFGVMGGFMQPQGHYQVMVKTIDYDMNPQAALDAPRWQWMQGKTVNMEYGTPHHILEGLKDRGHDVKPEIWGTGAGRGQIIWRQDNGTLVGGTDPRIEGAAMAW